MGKNIDTKFFNFIGIDVNSIPQKIKQIETLCNVKAISDYSETDIRQKCIDYFTKVNLCSLSDMPLPQILKAEIRKTYFYKEDIDAALYMLVGSWCSEWETSVLSADIEIPFSIIYNKYDTESSAWCRAFQRLFGNENRAFLLSNIKAKTRVEKYSYIKIQNICKELGKIVNTMKMDFQKYETKSALTTNEKKKLDYHFYMSPDGKENVILLDWILGISFSEICFFYTSQLPLKSRERAGKIVECLSKIKCYHIRNKMTEMILQEDILKIENEDTTGYKKYCDALKNIVSFVNAVYSVSLYKAWNDYKNSMGNEIFESWKAIIIENGFHVFIPLYGRYHSYVHATICKEKGIKEIPEILKKNLLDDPNIGGIEILKQLENLSEYQKGLPTPYTVEHLQSINDNSIGYTELSELYTVEQIESRNRILMQEEEKRGEIKKPKTLNEWYIKIQSIAATRWIVGNFPSFFN